MEILTFNIKNFKLIDGDFVKSDNFSEMIYENDGSYSNDCQYMTFECGDLKIDINFEMSISGSISEDSGDYWTPPSCDVDIDDVDITITDVFINEDEVELTPELKKVFLNIVNSNL